MLHELGAQVSLEGCCTPFHFAPALSLAVVLYVIVDSCQGVQSMCRWEAMGYSRRL